MLKIVIGCYEQMLLGYNVVKTEDGYETNLDFTDHSHTGCIKTVAVGKNFLASGSTDEIIYLFNLKKNKEEGALYTHDGSITKLLFAKENIMFSASEDGNICVFDSGKKWEKLKILKGHKDVVLDISVHPSGKIGLSISKDLTLRTWNLINGRVAYVKNIKQLKPTFVAWDPVDGEHYVLASLTTVQVFELATANVVGDIKFKNPILALRFIGKSILAVGGEDGIIHIYNITDSEKCLLKINAHEMRIKALDVIEPPSGWSNDGSKWVISGSSGGEVKIFELNLDDLPSISPEPVLTFESSARITCIASWKND